MEVRKSDRIAGIKFEGSSFSERKYIGFHIDNLEVAEITSELFELLPFKVLPLDGLLLKDSDESLQAKLKHNDTLISELQEWENSSTKDISIKSTKFREGNVHTTNHEVTDFQIKSLNINVTQICNLHCKYCAAGGDGSYGNPQIKINVQDTLPQIHQFMRVLNAGDRFHISFLGGEPLLYPEGVRLICEYATKLAEEKNIFISFKLTTNGTILNDYILKIFKDYAMSVVVSIDGPEDINDRMRPLKSARSLQNLKVTQMIVKNIETLKIYRGDLGPITVHAVFNEENMEVLKAYSFFRELDMDGMDFTFTVNKSNEDSHQLFLKQMQLLADKAWKLGGEKELRKIYIFDHYFDLLDEQRKIENHCGVGKSLAVIDAQNKIYNCPWTVGSLENQIGHKDEIFVEKLVDFKSTLITRNKCEGCWVKHLCGGGCSYVHDSLESRKKGIKNQHFCDRTRFLVSLSLYYYLLSREYVL